MSEIVGLDKIKQYSTIGSSQQIILNIKTSVGLKKKAWKRYILQIVTKTKLEWLN